jgi:hypothetical protein
MADDPPIEPPPPEPAPMPEPPPVESWVAYPTATPPQKHSLIVNALSDDTWWIGYDVNQGGINWDNLWSASGYWECRDMKVAEIINAAVLDFREAFGAVFDETGKNNPTFVPTSCLAYIDAMVQYNICIRFDLYNLKEDGVTRVYVKDYFEGAWKQASVYRRHIATMRRYYREELNAPSAVQGTPVLIPRVKITGRCL